jgi:hypothetical protein
VTPTDPGSLTGDWRRRLFFLGAGFSQPAGLPLSRELLPLVLDEIASLTDAQSHLHESLEQYLRYVRDTTGAAPAEVDLEAFAAYLDHAHTLTLRGSETWSEEGNQDQCLLRWGIGRVLHRHTPPASGLPSVYLRFAEQLRPRDLVVTFNYDVVLERALEAVGRAYRRFPHRYTDVGVWASTVDSERDDEEVCLLKVHGSIDWVSRRSFDQHLERMRETNGEQGVAYSARRDLVFGPAGCTTTRSLVEGDRPDEDRLVEVDVIENLDGYYGKLLAAYQHPPVILAPSQAKLLYGEQLRDFWSGLPTFAFAWGGLTVIGYSLPEADPYARQALYDIATGYIWGRTHPDYLPGQMRKIVVVDYRPDPASRRRLRKAYRFLDRSHTRFVVDGFDEQAVRTAFSA